MTFCKECNIAISQERLEVLPDTKICSSCIQAKVYTPPAKHEYEPLVPNDTIIVRSRNEKSFVIKPKKPVGKIALKKAVAQSESESDSDSDDN